MRVLSGTQPSHDHLHIGNYFGALRQQVELQQKFETLIFIADLHSMNSVRNADDRRRFSRAVALDFLASGLDPERAILFRQSDVPEVCELAWYLSTVTPMGLLERGHAYKDKIAQGQSANHGLFAYPVLMAADILLYRADLVPVGSDQKQHIEMARDMAEAFNRSYETEVLALPEPYILDDVAVVPGIDGRKMSKSYANTIPMFASQKEIKKAVMAIVTDSTPVEDPKDTKATLFEIWSLFATPDERAQCFARARAGGLGYGEVKQDLLRRLLEYFGPMRDRRAELEQRPDQVEAVLIDGAKRARAIGMPILDDVRRAAGFRARG
ncbi:MAG TPA: tryptophan--tRNA ligase [Myxococcota bacterium]|nr:tryptophan--tRNA ligase [Myxococcota bacterium]